ncbi:hypothetical protein B0187_06740 [Haemophilus paracuniculus]|uniref:Uncharacterized protein n=1 Tax=Haemophilus paracuniculus TaxID=734 RepID=A0A1T0AR71_9PAST|nr:hypothetical protein B0187_06740 [Haemophilus paracuniculus]
MVEISQPHEITRQKWHYKMIRDVIFQSPLSQSEIATASGTIGQEFYKFGTQNDKTRQIFQAQKADEFPVSRRFCEKWL